MELPLRLPDDAPGHGDVTLRAFREDDVPMLLDLSTDPHVPLIGTLPAHTDRAGALAYIARQHERPVTGAGWSFCIARTDTDEALGQAGLWVREIEHGRASVGYLVAPSARGHGYAGQALRALTDFAWTVPEIQRVELYVEPWNVASIRTAEAAGYAREGLLRRHQVVGDRRADMYLYAALRPRTPWPMTVDGIVLREATAADVEALLTFRNDPDVNRFMMRTSVDPEEFRRDWLAIPASDTDFSCVAERDGEVVAMGFLEVQDGSGQPGMPTGTEGLIGYIVRPSAWRTGVATAVTKGVLSAAFDRLGLRRVVAYCNADNTGSVRALERAGMRREQHGVEDSWHAELGWVDGYQYAMLQREWQTGAIRSGGPAAGSR